SKRGGKWHSPSVAIIIGPMHLFRRSGPLLLFFVWSASAQSPEIQQQIEERTGRPPARLVDVVTLPTDRTVRKKLEAAAEYIKEERWADAVRLLQNILDSKEDAFVEPGSKRSGRSSDRLLGARGKVERMLAALPRKGVEFYRLRYEGDARQKLDEAKRRADPELMAETFRRYPHTTGGAEALTLLAIHHPDRGRATTAARCFQSLLTLPNDELSARTLFHAALAFRRAGDTDQAERVWQRLVARLGNEGLRLGEKLVALE